MSDDYIAVPTGLGPMTKDQTIQYLLDRIEALERERDLWRRNASDNWMRARREALEEAAKLVDEQAAWAGGRAGKHLSVLAAAIRALKEGE